jgi:hypothetical protein
MVYNDMRYLVGKDANSYVIDRDKNRSVLKSIKGDIPGVDAVSCLIDSPYVIAVSQKNNCEIQFLGEQIEDPLHLIDKLINVPYHHLPGSESSINGEVRVTPGNDCVDELFQVFFLFIIYRRVLRFYFVAIRHGKYGKKKNTGKDNMGDG